MALTYSERGALGSVAPDFELPGVDGESYSLASFQDARALVLVIMCNHCPYVIAVQDRINALAREYAPRGVRLVAINPNDAVNYPDDSFEAMKVRAREKGYVFPYLRDESQQVVKAYGAVCTPEFYVLEPSAKGEFVFRYRGRLDDNWKDASAVKTRDLALALDALLDGKPVPRDQKPSMGCSIKWAEKA